MIPKASAPRSRRMSPWLLAGGPALAIAVAVAAVTWRMVAERPVRRCEAALTAMEQGDGSRDPERIRGAVDQCGAAARGRPDSGRAQFLAGQAHSLNGGSRLASAYWRRAALAGDPDGLAAHGRDLWLSGPGDGATMREALRLLERAADRGSAAAVEDMAEIYRDGIGVAIDLPRAEQLLKRAGEIRRDNDR